MHTLLKLVGVALNYIEQHIRAKTAANNYNYAPSLCGAEFSINMCVASITSICCTYICTEVSKYVCYKLRYCFVFYNNTKRVCVVTAITI